MDDEATPGPDLPPITEQMRGSARANPNSWLYVFDPAYGEADVNVNDVPQYAIVGAYPVNDRGEIEERFAPNDTYRPSPTALGWPTPLSYLERIIQLAKAGHRPPSDVPMSVLDADLLMYDPGDGSWDGTELTVLPDEPTGRLVVPACSSVEHVPADWPAFRTMAGDEVVLLLRGYPLAINPDGPVSAILPHELLLEAAKTQFDVHRTDGDDGLRGKHHAD